MFMLHDLMTTETLAEPCALYGNLLGGRTSARSDGRAEAPNGAPGGLTGWISAHRAQVCRARGRH